MIVGKFEIYGVFRKFNDVQLTTLNTATGSILNIDQLSADDIQYLHECIEASSPELSLATTYVNLLKYKLDEAFKTRTGSHSMTFVQTNESDKDVWRVKQGEDIKDITILDCSLFIKQQLEPIYPPSLAKYIYSYLINYCLEDDGKQYDDIYFSDLFKHNKLSVMTIVIKKCDSKCTVEFVVKGFNDIFKYESRVTADGTVKVTYKCNADTISKPSKVALQLFKRVVELHSQTVSFIEGSLNGDIVLADNSKQDVYKPNLNIPYGYNPFLEPLAGLRYEPPSAAMYPNGFPHAVFKPQSFPGKLDPRQSSYPPVAPHAY